MSDDAEDDRPDVDDEEPGSSVEDEVPEALDEDDALDEETALLDEDDALDEETALLDGAVALDDDDDTVGSGSLHCPSRHTLPEQSPSETQRASGRHPATTIAPHTAQQLIRIT